MIPEGGGRVCQDLMEAARQGWDRGPEVVLVPAHPVRTERQAQRFAELAAADCRGAAVAEDCGAKSEGRVFSVFAGDFSDADV